ncbi:response regulator [Erythrobacter sp. SDW2]|uniref:response regulator n=1 Tax=Erythrobacter sp. SDW2 TaxID=2907154 RepID=UPI001F268239|nr:response regulator [Erythrobacter sp. SDW2]UIP08275.1 response regulator [Erythrobacter sp. SDW2]
MLLAEDTAISADMMQVMAERLRISMDVAPNGLEAIEMIKAANEEGEPYSLLLVDIMMPILDGIETARRLRREGIDADELPIIAITAAADLEEVRSYRKAGMQAFLEKPVALADLRATLHAWGHGTEGRAQKLRAAAYDALTEQFRQRKQSTITALEEALAKPDLSENHLHELRRILHQLAGTAGSFGEPALGEAARGFEIELMAAWFDGDDPRTVIKQAAIILGQQV